MRRTIRTLLMSVFSLAVIVGGYFLIRSMGSGRPAEETPWTVVDQAYVPRGAVEEFIKADAERQGALPVQIRNHGRNSKVLARFRGKQFARPSENVLALFFKGLDDWTIVDIKFKTESEREAQRTLLYVLENGQWKVGDTGTLQK